MWLRSASMFDLPVRRASDAFWAVQIDTNDMNLRGEGAHEAVNLSILSWLRTPRKIGWWTLVRSVTLGLRTRCSLRLSGPSPPPKAL